MQLTIESGEGGPGLTGERALLAAALDDLQAIYMTMLGKANESVHHVGLQGNRILMATAETVLAWLLVRHAAIALAKRDGASDDDRAYYDGKVASARFFCREVLPNVTYARGHIERSAMDIMDLPVEAF